MHRASSPTAAHSSASVIAGIMLLLACGTTEVSAPPPVDPLASVEVGPEELVLVPPLTAQLFATLRDAAGAPLSPRPVTWTTSEPGVALVATNGTVTAVRPGSARISASVDGYTGSTLVRVFPILRVIPDLPSLFSGDTILLRVMQLDANAEPLAPLPTVWEHLSPSVATVQDGVVRGETSGLAGVRVGVTVADRLAWDTVEVAVLEPRIGTDREIAYIGEPGNTFTADLRIVPFEGGSPATIGDAEGGAGVQEFRWSPGGDRLYLLYSSRNGVGKEGVYFANADGTGEIHVGNDIFDGDWSPAGDRLAYRQRIAFGQSDVFTMAPDGLGRQRLTSRADDELTPRWSPDGRGIAYRHSRSDGAVMDLRIMRTDGTADELIPIPVQPLHVVWSPDGKRLAFDNGPGVWVVDAAGTTLRSVSQNCDLDGTCDEGLQYAFPSWSPDGRRLAYVGWSPDEQVLVIADPDDGPITTVSLDGAATPQWSPSGSWIAIGATNPAGGWPSVAKVSADGATVVFLTDGENASSPRWR